MIHYRHRLIGISALVMALLAGIGCGSSDMPAMPEPGGPINPVLATALSAETTLGRDGGELSVSGQSGEASYRLIVPAGALSSDTQVSLTPIADIEGFPFSGGLLGGVELRPDGQKFGVPVTLEIRLDPTSQGELRTALDQGLIVFGFSYPDGGSLSVDVADVAPDLSVIRLHLAGASGHGAGLGQPGDQARLGPPADPATAARSDITDILYPATGPADPNDPAVRGDIADVMRGWFNSTILPGVSADSDLASFEAAVLAYRDWWELGRIFGLVREFWYSPNDVLGAEGLIFKTAALLEYELLVADANEACKQNGDIADLMRLINLNDLGTLSGLTDAATSGSRLASIMSPANFCIKFKIVGIDAPSELAEQATGTIGFTIVSDRPGVHLTAQDLKTLGVSGTFDAVSPLFFNVATSPVELDGTAIRVETPVTALQAREGRTDEGKVQLGVTVLTLGDSHATSEVTIDVTRANAPISCSGSPTTITSIDDHPDKIAISYDGRSSCRIAAILSSDDDPNLMLFVDTDPGETGWDAGDGQNWSREPAYNDDIPPGTHTVRFRHEPSGRSFDLTLTVELVLIGGGPNTTMTVRDATISVPS